MGVHTFPCVALLASGCCRPVFVCVEEHMESRLQECESEVLKDLKVGNWVFNEMAH